MYQDKFSKEFFQGSFETGVLTSRGLYRRIWLDELVYGDKKTRTFLEIQRKLLQIQKKNFFRISKSSDVGRSLENVLGKFREFSPSLWPCQVPILLFATVLNVAYRSLSDVTGSGKSSLVRVAKSEWQKALQSWGDLHRWASLCLWLSWVTFMCSISGYRIKCTFLFEY